MTTVGDVGAMYETGVLAENPNQASALFRKRMGYVNPDPQLSRLLAAPNQSAWHGKTHFKTPLVSGIHSGQPPGQEIETTIYQKRAMNPIWPPPPKHRMAMINPTWQQATNAFGGHSGTIEMLAGNHQFPLPSANDSLEQVSALALDENARKAINDPLSNTFALNQLRQEQDGYYGEGREQELRYMVDDLHSQALGKETSLEFINRRRKDRGEFELKRDPKADGGNPSSTDTAASKDGKMDHSPDDSGFGAAGFGRGTAGLSSKILEDDSTYRTARSRGSEHSFGLDSAATGSHANSHNAWNNLYSTVRDIMAGPGGPFYYEQTDPKDIRTPKEKPFYSYASDSGEMSSLTGDSASSRSSRSSRKSKGSRSVDAPFSTGSSTSSSKIRRTGPAPNLSEIQASKEVGDSVSNHADGSAAGTKIDTRAPQASSEVMTQEQAASFSIGDPRRRKFLSSDNSVAGSTGSSSGKDDAASRRDSQGRVFLKTPPSSVSSRKSGKKSK